jgi:hypothetical protein
MRSPLYRMQWELSQRLNRLEFVVHIDGPSIFPNSGEDAVIDDAGAFFSSWVICRGAIVSIRIIIDRFGALSRTQRNGERSSARETS